MTTNSPYLYSYHKYSCFHSERIPPFFASCLNETIPLLPRVFTGCGYDGLVNLGLCANCGQNNALHSGHMACGIYGILRWANWSLMQSLW